MMVGALLGIAGLIYCALGVLHAVFTVLDARSPKRLAPDDPATLAAMQASKVRLSRGAVTMWDAWISFNLTHSLAAISMGTACFIIMACFGIFAFPPVVLLALAGVSCIYLLIGLKYWFGAPRAGTIIATACLAVAWLLYSF